MKRLFAIGAGLALLSLLVGCTDYFEAPPPRPPERISVPPLPVPPPASSQRDGASQR